MFVLLFLLFLVACVAFVADVLFFFLSLLLFAQLVTTCAVRCLCCMCCLCGLFVHAPVLMCRFFLRFVAEVIFEVFFCWCVLLLLVGLAFCCCLVAYHACFFRDVASSTLMFAVACFFSLPCCPALLLLVAQSSLPLATSLFSPALRFLPPPYFWIKPFHVQNVWRLHNFAPCEKTLLHAPQRMERLSIGMGAVIRRRQPRTEQWPLAPGHCQNRATASPASEPV